MNIPHLVQDVEGLQAKSHFPFQYLLLYMSRPDVFLGIETAVLVSAVHIDIQVLPHFHVPRKRYSYHKPAIHIEEIHGGEELALGTRVPGIQVNPELGKKVIFIEEKFEPFGHAQIPDGIARGTQPVAQGGEPHIVGISYVRKRRDPAVGLSRGEEIACVINPRMGREYEGRLTPAEKKERIVVVGAGPAGCEAACAAAERGHEVILFEKERMAGGRVRIAALPPFKKQLSAYAEYLEGKVHRSSVHCLFGEEADAEKIAALKPDRIILAVGAAALVPSLPGLETHGFLLAEDVLSGDRKALPEQVTVLGGGMVGAETAEKLAEEGRSVTIVEMRDTVAQDVEPRSRKLLLRRLEQLGVVMKTNARVLSVEPESLLLDECGERVSFPLKGALVLAMGYRAEHRLTAGLEALGFVVEEVGDAREAADIMTAVRQGFDAGRR